MSYQEIDREDIVLLVIDANRRLLGSEAFRGITRLEKLIFLFSRETDLPDLEKKFEFRPYKYGPFSPRIYDAVDFLQGIGLVKGDTTPIGSAYTAAEEDELAEEDLEDDIPAAGVERAFSLTPTGRKAAAALRESWEKEHPQDLSKLDEIVGQVSPLPLGQIIRYVYRRHPTMAAKSVHPEAKRLSAE